MPRIYSDSQAVRVKTEHPPLRRSTRRRARPASGAAEAPPPAVAVVPPTPSTSTSPLVKPLPAYNSLPLEQYLDAIVEGTMSLQDVLAHAMAVAAASSC
jgi:hypothetical protein